MSALCDGRVYIGCRKGTVDFAHLSHPWVYSEQNSERPAVWATISFILSLCQVGLTYGSHVSSQLSNILRLRRACRMRCFSPLGLTCSGCSCSLPLRGLLLMPLVCHLLVGHMTVLVSDLHYPQPQLGNSIFTVGLRTSWHINVDRYYFGENSLPFWHSLFCCTLEHLGL